MAYDSGVIAYFLLMVHGLGPIAYDLRVIGMGGCG